MISSWCLSPVEPRCVDVGCSVFFLLSPFSSLEDVVFLTHQTFLAVGGGAVSSNSRRESGIHILARLVRAGVYPFWNPHMHPCGQTSMSLLTDSTTSRWTCSMDDSETPSSSEKSIMTSPSAANKSVKKSICVEF